MPCAPIPHGMLCAPLIHGVEVAVHVEDPITKRGALKRAPRFAVRPVWVLSLGLKSRTNPLVGMVSELQGAVW